MAGKSGTIRGLPAVTPDVAKRVWQSLEKAEPRDRASATRRIRPATPPSAVRLPLWRRAWLTLKSLLNLFGGIGWQQLRTHMDWKRFSRSRWANPCSKDARLRPKAARAWPPLARIQCRAIRSWLGRTGATPASWSSIALTCRDPLAVEWFYTRYFGFRRALRLGGGRQIVFIRNGGMYLELFSTPPTPAGQGDGPHYPGVRHIRLQGRRSRRHLVADGIRGPAMHHPWPVGF